MPNTNAIYTNYLLNFIPQSLQFGRIEYICVNIMQLFTPTDFIRYVWLWDYFNKKQMKGSLMKHEEEFNENGTISVNEYRTYTEKTNRILHFFYSHANLKNNPCLWPSSVSVNSEWLFHDQIINND